MPKETRPTGLTPEKDAELKLEFGQLAINKKHLETQVIPSLKQDIENIIRQKGTGTLTIEQRQEIQKLTGMLQDNEKSVREMATRMAEIQRLQGGRYGNVVR